MRDVLTCILLFFSISLQAQESLTVKGKITDALDQQHIPYVSVGISGAGRGTLTNLSGEFELRVDSLPVKLTFAHVGYKRQELTVSQLTEELGVSLELAFILDNVVIEAKGSAELYRIFKRAITQTRQQSRKDHFGRSFYRQLSTNDDNYTELYEIFYDSRFNANGINGWALQEGRYALAENDPDRGFVFNKNFTLINRIFPTLQPQVDLFITPFGEGLEEQYALNTVRIIQQEDSRVAVIGFTPITDFTGNTPAMEGEAFIDMETYDILKLTGKFVSNQLKVITFNDLGGEVDKYELHYESNFRRNEEGDLLLDFIRSHQEFDVVYPDKPKQKIETNSLLTVYEYYQPERKNRQLGGRINTRRSDQSLINQVGYDLDFWRDNPIVKRTPVEEEVIRSFESERRFGSIYLNNRNQVAFMPELETDPAVQVLMANMKRAVPAQEKVYLHLDKPYYVHGDDLWFKAYVVDASLHRPLDASQFLYVDLINPEGTITVQHKLPLNALGQTHGDFALDHKMLPGRYQVRAYTDRMTRFDHDYLFTQEFDLFGKSLEITRDTINPDTIQFAFFPEGGDLVSGLPGRLAFKATDKEGNPVDISGSIVDNEGRMVTPLASQHAGMGSVIFQPQGGKTYRASVQWSEGEATYDLPSALSEGVVMSVRNSGDSNIGVRVIGTPTMEGEEFYLIGQTRGVVYYKGKGVLRNRILNFEVPRNLIPAGVLHLTLMDRQMRPQSERLTFVYRDDELNVEIKTNKRHYDGHDKVNLGVAVKDAFGEPVTSVLSLAVTDRRQVNRGAYGGDIRSYFLLTSDLRGRVHDPGYYLSSSKEAVRAADLLMLTQGWRRFTWKSVMEEDPEPFPTFTDGFTVCGKLDPKDAWAYAGADLTLVVMGGWGSLYSTKTFGKETFCFEGVNFADTTSLVLQAITSSGEQVDLNFTLDEPRKLSTNFHSEAFRYPENEGKTFMRPAPVLLAEELVVEKPASNRNQGKLVAAPDYVHILDEKDAQQPDILMVLQGKVPGVQVSPAGVRMPGSTGQPLFILDEIPLNQQGTVSQRTVSVPTADGGTREEIQTVYAKDDFSLLQFVRSVRPQEVERIELLKGPSAAVLGSRGMNGVIAIYTHRGNLGDPLKSKQLPGYYTAREFFTPHYSSGQVNPDDRRSTLYWNPEIELNAEGKVDLDFYNSALAGEFDIILQGVTAQGRPITAAYSVSDK